MEGRIGHYSIVSELGRGGMGVVYKAHEESLNRFVALKVLGKHLSEDENFVERFKREARSAAALNHPNIVKVYAIDEFNGQHYFAMEYVEGSSILQIVKQQGPMAPVAAAPSDSADRLRTRRRARQRHPAPRYQTRKPIAGRTWTGEDR